MAIPQRSTTIYITLTLTPTLTQTLTPTLTLTLNLTHLHGNLTEVYDHLHPSFNTEEHPGAFVGHKIVHHRYHSLERIFGLL